MGRWPKAVSNGVQRIVKAIALAARSIHPALYLPVTIPLLRLPPSLLSVSEGGSRHFSQSKLASVAVIAVVVNVAVIRERLQLVQQLGIAIHGLQIVHNCGLRRSRRLFPVGDAQIGSAAY